MAAFVLDANIRITDVIGLQQAQQQIAAVAGGGAGAQNVTAGATAQSVASTAALTAQINKLTTANASLSSSSAKAKQSLGATTAAMNTGGKAAQGFASQVALAGKRYGAFIAATAIPFAGLAILREATQSVIEFDEAVIRVQQITNEGGQAIDDLRNTFLDLSVATGTSAVELANVARTLAQAGIRGERLTEVLSQLAKVPLTPAFGSTDSALQGLLAVLNQFEDEALSTTEVLDVLTNVSNNFAATAEDLFQGFARGGAAFEAIGGDFREFAALLAVVRQETRESASTVGTFFKTLSSRLADPKIIEFLRGKGINLIGDTGQFIGAVPAIRELADALNDIVLIQDKVDIATKVAGRRQVSRFLALTSSIDEVDRALQTADNSAGAFNKQAELGLTTLRAQLNILAAEFVKLFQSLAEPVFVPLIQSFTLIASAAASAITAISPIIPIFTQIGIAAAGIKLTTLAVAGLAAASKALAGVQLTGITGLLGGGAAVGGAGSALAGQFSGAGAATAGGQAALVASTTGVVATSKALIKLNLGQIAITGLVIAGLNSFNDNLRESGSDALLFGSNLVQILGGAAIAGSLLGGGSIIEVAKKAVTTVGGAFLAASTIIVTGVILAAQKTAASFEENTERALAEIKNIDVDFDAGADLGKALGDLGTAAINKIRRDVESTIGTGDEGLGESLILSLQTVVKKIGDRLSGDFSGDLFSEDEIEALLANLFNAEKAKAIFDEAVTEFGTDFKGGILGLLSNFLQDLGFSFDQASSLATTLTDSIVKAQGQQGLINALIAAEGTKQARAQKQINQELKRITSDLTKIKVPSIIRSELQALGDVVGKAVTAVDLSVTAFDSLAKNIGKIGVPDIPIDISDKAIDNLIKDRSQFEELLGDSFSDLGNEARSTILLADAMEQLGEAAISAFGQTEKLRSSLDVEQLQAKPEEFIKEFLENFLSVTDLPPEVAADIKRIGFNVISKAIAQLVPADAESDSFLAPLKQEFQGQRDEILQFVRAEIKDLLTSIFTGTQASLENSIVVFEQRIKSLKPLKIAETLNNVIGDLEGFELPTIDTNLNDTRKSIENWGAEILRSGEFSDLAAVALREQAEAAKEFILIQQGDDGNIVEARKRVEEADKAVVGFSEVLVGLKIAIDSFKDAPDAVAEGVGHLGDELDAVTQEFGELQAVLAQKIAQEIKDAGFATSIDTFRGSIDVFDAASKLFAASVGIELTADRAGIEARSARERGEDGDILDISRGDQDTVRTTPGGQLEEVFDFTARDKLLKENRALGDSAKNIQEEFVRLTEEASNAASIMRSLAVTFGTLDSFIANIESDVIKDISQRRGSEGEEAGLGNAQNFRENIDNFLSGALAERAPGRDPIGAAEFDNATIRELDLLKQANLSDAKAAADSAKASAAESKSSAEVTAQRVAEARAIADALDRARQRRGEGEVDRTPERIVPDEDIRGGGDNAELQVLEQILNATRESIDRPIEIGERLTEEVSSAEPITAEIGEKSLSTMTTALGTQIGLALLGLPLQTEQISSSDEALQVAIDANTAATQVSTQSLAETREVAGGSVDPLSLEGLFGPFLNELIGAGTTGDLAEDANTIDRELQNAIDSNTTATQESNQILEQARDISETPIETDLGEPEKVTLEEPIIASLDPASVDTLFGPLLDRLSGDNVTTGDDTQVGETPVETATDIGLVAEQLANATQAALDTTIGIASSSEALQIGAQILAQAAETFSVGISDFSAVVDVQRETQGQQDTELLTVTSELVAANQANTDAVSQSIESLTALTDKLSQRIEQASNPEPIPIEELKIEGLDEVADASQANVEALGSNESSLTDLSQTLEDTQRSIEEGLDIDLNAVQSIIVDVQGLEDGVSAFQQAFADVAVGVAKEQIRIALIQLANTLKDTETSQAVQSIANNF